MSLVKEQIASEISELRRIMVEKSIEVRSLTHPDVVKISQLLDRKINDYINLYVK